MITAQELFDKASNSLRTYGNPYGSLHSRGWSWCNPNNPSQRCALAQFIVGNTKYEVVDNFDHLVGEDTLTRCVAREITWLFDFWPVECNDNVLLEERLKMIASKHNLQYKEPITSKEDVSISETV